MKIFKQNYDAIVKRGLITSMTTDIQFYRKAVEELREVHEAFINEEKEHLNEEITDLMNVCSVWLQFRKCDPVKELEKCLDKNLKRCK